MDNLIDLNNPSRTEALIMAANVSSSNLYKLMYSFTGSDPFGVFESEEYNPSGYEEEEQRWEEEEEQRLDEEEEQYWGEEEEEEPRFEEENNEEFEIEEF